MKWNKAWQQYDRVWNYAAAVLELYKVRVKHFEREIYWYLQ